MIADMLGRLPTRYHWTLHNMIAHPLSEILHLLNLPEASRAVHDATVPKVRAGRE